MSDLFSQVLNMSLTGSVVILLVLMARMFLKRYPKVFSYALWAVVLFRLLCPVSITAPVSVLKPLQPQAREVAEHVAVVSYIPERPVPEPDTPAVPKETQPPLAATIVQPETEKTMSAMDFAALVWISGAASLLLYSLIQYILLRLRLLGAVSLKDRLYLSDRIQTAFVLGFLPPKIYLPTNVPLEERQFIIAHECHHIRRGDHIIKWFAYLALCVHWFNPLAWLAFVLAGQDMEMSCDEAVIKKLGSHIRADYSTALLRLATGYKRIAGTPLAFGEGDPKNRIRNMANWKKPKVWVSALCVFLCLVFLFFCAVNPQQDDRIKTLSKDSLESCWEALETIQRAENCMIKIFRTNSGGSVLNATSEGQYFKAGEDWMLLNMIPETNWESVFAYLYRDGTYYDNVSTYGVENGHILWNASTDRNVQKPWLLSFQWKEETVELLDRWEDQEGTHILLQINEPLKDLDDVAETYTVEFLFSTDDAFHGATLKASFLEADGQLREMESTMFAGTFLDGSAIEQQIDVAFRSKVPPMVASVDGQTGTYGALSMTVPEGYSWKTCRTGLTLYRDGVDVGGVTYWNTPEEDEDWINSLGLWDAISGASYMVSFWDSQDMVTASFTNEASRESLDHAHTFYIEGSVTYNVWLNANLLTREEITDLWKCVSVSDEAPEWEEAQLPGERIQYRKLNLELPLGYGLTEMENGNLSIEQENTVIGGIDAYEIPGGALTTYDPYFKWLESLSIPDYADESLCYMGGGSLYGDWEIHFESDVPPGEERTVSRYHTFFVEEDMVYDVWIDMRLVNTTTKNQILSALTGQDSYMETQPPAEGQEIVTDGLLYSDSFQSADGTVSITINTYLLPEVLEIAGEALDSIQAAVKQEFLSSNLDGYGLNTTDDGHVGAKCEVTVTEVKTGTYVHPGKGTIPTLEIWGLREYIFANGDRLGREQGEFCLITLSAQDGEVLILESFPRLEPKAKEPTMDQAEALEKCRDSLDSIQSGSYVIFAEESKRDSEGAMITFSTLYASYEEDWLRIHYVPMGEDQERHASMGVGDRTFHNKGHWSDAELVWQEGEASNAIQPWLSTFRWTEDNMTCTHVSVEGDKEVAHLRISEPYPDAESTDHYFADFWFDSQGNFLKAELTAEYQWRGIYSTAKKTESLAETIPMLVSPWIYSEYANAVGK